MAVAVPGRVEGGGGIGRTRTGTWGWEGGECLTARTDGVGGGGRTGLLGHTGGGVDIDAVL